MKELLINGQIKDREVRLIDANGVVRGIIPTREALQIAEDEGLDLCLVTPPEVKPATCKLMDYGKYRYEQQKRDKDARKNQHTVETKEVRLSATIDVGDVKRLAKQASEFIKDGNKVLATIRLKGRQQAHPEIAFKIIDDFIALVGDGVVVDKKPSQSGRMISVTLSGETKK